MKFFTEELGMLTPAQRRVFDYLYERMDRTVDVMEIHHFLRGDVQKTSVYVEVHIFYIRQKLIQHGCNWWIETFSSPEKRRHYRLYKMRPPTYANIREYYEQPGVVGTPQAYLPADSREEVNSM